MVSLAAIALAGGQSSRMGQDKALLELDGIPLIQRTYQIAQQYANPVYVVTPWIERYREVLPANCQFIQETWKPEEAKPHGPLVGFAQALTYVETEWVLLLACDLPYLKLEILQNWIAELENVSVEAIALLPKNPQGWWEPLCGFYRSNCLPELTSFVESGGRSFQKWLTHQSVQELTLDNVQMLFNCNTPEEWAIAKSE
ncbi:molybdenum cofactor guanylyltransferase [Leptolyngbya sp. FACHB-541]|uniref:molybdenum cofactor guanylyltransferase n=1 Tax=Leptolyngbya sp. FACHB-541 TaxID=2692810 RepID=UPI0016870D53|nr:molybdenum cofactor guanylyltransferase [Leptolyngbya sp. FACHB-541]MBD1995906.1 molybdenum cofactor guanylyltransferase [Leptolyngbya sp. FACHB-541]